MIDAGMALLERSFELLGDLVLKDLKRFIDRISKGVESNGIIVEQLKLIRLLHFVFFLHI